MLLYKITDLRMHLTEQPSWSGFLGRDVHVVVVAGRIFNMTSVFVSSTAHPREYLSSTIIVVFRRRYDSDCRGPRAWRPTITPGR